MGETLCLTIYSYKKDGLSEEEYRAASRNETPRPTEQQLTRWSCVLQYMLKTHAPLASTLMEKYGITSFNMTHMNSTTRPMLAEIAGSHFENIQADYDVVSQMCFKSLESFRNMISDPFYLENVMPDDKNFANMQKTKMSLGWISDVVKDGKRLVGDADASTPSAT